jgi:hypothetical protein
MSNADPFRLNPPRPWWKGDIRVEPFMKPINDALKKHNIADSARIEIYNRAYEAVFMAITMMEGNQ